MKGGGEGDVGGDRIGREMRGRTKRGDDDRKGEERATPPHSKAKGHCSQF